jgi:hypothetical protein
MELADFIAAHRQALSEAVLRKTVEWWSEKRSLTVSEEKALLDRCADQLAAAILFQHLNSIESPNHCFWDTLIDRVIRRILLPILKSRGILKFGETPSIDLVNHCILAIYSRAKTFRYRNLGSAIIYFTHHSVWKEIIAAEGMNESSIEFVDNLTDPLLEGIADTYERLPSNPASLSQRPWDMLLDAVDFNRETAIRYWILSQFRELHYIEWADILEIVTTPVLQHWDDILPLDVPWEEAYQAFEEWRNVPTKRRAS